MSGGLIGSSGEVAANVTGHLCNTPIYLGCDANDPHIPYSRVLETKQVLERLGADVLFEQYQAWGHRPHPNAEAFLRQYV